MKKKTALLLAYLFFWTILPAWRPVHAVPVIKDLIVKNSPWVDITAYKTGTAGIANDNVDDDAALVAATAAALATGQPLVIPAGQFDFSNQWVISSDYDSFYKPLTVICAGSDSDARSGKVIPVGGTILNFKYGGGPKIVGDGRGRVNIRGCNFYNSSTDNQAFIKGLATIWDIQNNSFWGGTNRNGGIIFGGNTVPPPGFQGYGTIVSGNFFQRIHRIAHFHGWANGIVFTNNTVWTGSGGDTSILMDNTNTGAISGNVVMGNIIEMLNYTNGITLSSNVVGNYFAGNGFYDPGDINKIYMKMNGASFNTVIESYSPNGDAKLVNYSEFGNNLLLRNTQAEYSYIPQLKIDYGKYFSAGGAQHRYYSGSTDNTWSAALRPYTAAGTQRWFDLGFFSDNGAVGYTPFSVRTFPDASWVNTTTDIYSDYTFRFKVAAQLEFWGDTINIKKSDGTTKGYFDANGLTVGVGTLNTLTGGSTTISSGAGTVSMSTANPATNTVWIPMRYNGNTYYVPGWTTNAP